MSMSGHEAVPEVRERLGSPKKSGKSQEALPEVWEGSGVPLKCPRVVVKPSQKFRKGQEALPNVREW